jgi:protein ImuA
MNRPPQKPEKTPLFSPVAGPRQAVVQTLKEQIARLEQTRLPTQQGPIPSGCQDLDQLLPDHGFHRGTLVEWLAAESGGGAETLALAAARSFCREGGVLVVLDSARELYPPAIARLGIDLEQLIVVQALNPADNLWALDQSLRCLAVAAVLAWPARLDGHTFRRLQLAAEEGGGLGLFVRPPAAEHEPSWADVRLRVEPLPGEGSSGRRLRIHLLRSRGGADGRQIDVEIDDETNTLRLAPRLAVAKDPRRAAGA